jgi:hypothetical protein
MRAVVIGYWEFRDDLNYWLPAFGSLDSGYALGQTLVLALLVRRYHFRNGHLCVLLRPELHSRLTACQSLRTFHQSSA